MDSLLVRPCGPYAELTFTIGATSYRMLMDEKNLTLLMLDIRAAIAQMRTHAQEDA